MINNVQIYFTYILDWWFTIRFMRPALVILALLIVAGFGYLASAWFSSPGVGISLTFYSKDGPLKTWFGAPALPGGRVYVEVYAVAPPTYDVPEIKVWNGTLMGPYLFIPYSGKFRDVVDGFYEYLKTSPITEEVRTSTKYGLRVDIWIFMKNGTVLTDTQYVTYSPWKIREGGRVDKQLRISLAQPMIKYNTQERLKQLTSSQLSTESSSISVEPLVTQVCVWQQEWIVTPEDLAENGAPYVTVNGVKYIETPTAIIDNNYFYSGIVESSFELITTYTTGIAVGIGVGYDISSKVNSGSYDVGSLGVTLYKSGYSVEKTVYFYTSAVSNPESTIYYYIYSRPYTVFEKEVCYYYGSPIGYPTGNERVRSYVTDFLVNGQDLVGGVKQGMPPTIVYDLLYDDSSTTDLIIIPTDPALNDGDLDVGESVAYAEIFNYYDSCNNGFEVSVPAGLLAAGVCSALTGGACAPFATLLAAIPISLELNPGSTSISVHGGLRNCGDGTACYIQGSNGYNTYEVIYTRVSKLKYRVDYWTGGYCEYNVPVSMYFRTD